MKMEILQNGAASFGRLIYKIHPQKSLLVLDKFSKLFWRDIFSDGFAWDIVKRPDHNHLKIRIFD